MAISRRDALTSFLFGAGCIGLRALATGLPAQFLLKSRKALANAPTCDTSKAQFFILSTSNGGDPIGCNAPGTYLDPMVTHPPTFATPARLTINGQMQLAAAPWATLSPSILNRSCFWHLKTNTSVHPHEQKVLKLMGAIQPTEMFPSLLTKNLAECLGTLQVQPVSVGASGASEGLSFGGKPIPTVKPSALKATLLNPTGPLTRLQHLRDQTLNAMYDQYKNGATTAQRNYIDSVVTSTQQVRGIEQNLLDQLTSIAGDDIDAQIIAAVTLIQMKVTPLIAIKIPFGRDNHYDPDLAMETDETVSGVANLATLMSMLQSAGLQDKVTFMSLNVFGRTMFNRTPGGSPGGRGHNAEHQLSLTISSALKGGVIGGIFQTRQFNSPEFGCTDIDSSTGAGMAGADIPRDDSLASFAKTVLTAVGIDSATVESNIPTGKVIRGALV